MARKECKYPSDYVSWSFSEKNSVNGQQIKNDMSRHKQKEEECKSHQDVEQGSRI